MQEKATALLAPNRVIPNRWLWVFAALVLVVVEFIVVGFHVMKHTHSPLSWRFYYLPVMLTLPLTTAWPLRRELMNNVLGGNAELTVEVSRALALVTLISYLTLLICICEYL